MPSLLKNSSVILLSLLLATTTTTGHPHYPSIVISSSAPVVIPAQLYACSKPYYNGNCTLHTIPGNRCVKFLDDEIKNGKHIPGAESLTVGPGYVCYLYASDNCDPLRQFYENASVFEGKKLEGVELSTSGIRNTGNIINDVWKDFRGKAKSLYCVTLKFPPDAVEFREGSL